MSIEKNSFDNELEFDIWVQNNFTQFFVRVFFFSNTRSTLNSTPNLVVLVKRRKRKKL
jgi:hypothetical protein